MLQKTTLRWCWQIPPARTTENLEQTICLHSYPYPYIDLIHLHQMSCTYLEITGGTAWGLMNSQTAGNSTTVFSSELSEALCPFIHCCILPSASPQQTGPVRQQGPWICKGYIPPPPVSFADPWLTVGLSQRKAISLTAWPLLQGNADLLHAPRLSALPLGYSGNHSWYWAVCLPFVLTLVTPQQKTEEIKTGNAAPLLRKCWKLFL